MIEKLKQAKRDGVFSRLVLVSALGYFVDIYDLVLFSIVRVASLKDLGVASDDLLPVGVYLINMQMTGMLLGGLLWGVIGDKKGRVAVLFGSILMYSTANIANAFVNDITVYGWLRFIAGIGLAGELGAAITLVCESLPKNARGLGTTIVSAIGVAGAVVAAQVGGLFSWRTAYVVGGVLGFLLLALRVGVFESRIYDTAKVAHKASLGSLKLIFANFTRFKRYAACILIGVPIWYIVGILITFSPEIARELGVTDTVSAGLAIMYCYIGLVVGDFASGFLSQALKSRKKVVYLFLVLSTIFIGGYGFIGGFSPNEFYALCVCLGFGSGYWAMFVTMASEQFGTNIRATVTTTAPNFVRGAVVPLSLIFNSLKSNMTLWQSALSIGAVCVAVAFYSLSTLKDSFATDLDFIED